MFSVAVEGASDSTSEVAPPKAVLSDVSFLRLPELEEKEATSAVPTRVQKFASRVFRCGDLATDTWGTCFYLCTEPSSKTKDKPRHLFASAARIFSSAAQPVITLQLQDDVRKLPASIASHVPESDLVILQIEEQLAQFPRDMEATEVLARPERGEDVFIVGVDGSFLPASVLTACILTNAFAKKPPGPHAVRFFVLDRTADSSLSGSPVVNMWGDVLGVLCDTNREGTCSWALIGCRLSIALVALETGISPSPAVLSDVFFRLP